MKKFIKNNLKTILTIIVTAIICISGTTFAAFQYNAKQIEYKNGKSVENALNELYNIKFDMKNVINIFENNNFSGVSYTNSFSSEVGHYYLAFYVRVNNNDNSLQSGANLVRTSEVYSGTGKSVNAYGRVYLLCATDTTIKFSGSDNLVLYIDLGTK